MGIFFPFFFFVNGTDRPPVTPRYPPVTPHGSAPSAVVALFLPWAQCYRVLPSFFFPWLLPGFYLVWSDLKGWVSGYGRGFSMFIEVDWVLRSFQWFLLSFPGFYRVLLGFLGFYVVLRSFQWFLLSFTGSYWVLQGFTGF